MTLKNQFVDAIKSIQNNLHHFIMMFVNDEQKVKDLFQESCIKIYSKFTKNISPDKLKFLAYKNIYKYAKTKGYIKNEDMKKTPEKSDFLVKDMKDALFCLPPFHRLLIFLCDKEGYKYLQISRILNINVEEVIAGLSLARKKIEEIYSKIS